MSKSQLHIYEDRSHPHSNRRFGLLQVLRHRAGFRIASRFAVLLELQVAKGNYSTSFAGSSTKYVPVEVSEKTVRVVRAVVEASEIRIQKRNVNGLNFRKTVSLSHSLSLSDSHSLSLSLSLFLSLLSLSLSLSLSFSSVLSIISQKILYLFNSVSMFAKSGVVCYRSLPNNRALSQSLLNLSLAFANLLALSLSCSLSLSLSLSVKLFIH